MHWDRRIAPGPTVYYFRTFQKDNGVAEVYEEKDHSSKLAQGKINLSTKSSRKNGDKSIKVSKRAKELSKVSKRPPGRPRKQ